MPTLAVRCAALALLAASCASYQPGSIVANSLGATYPNTFTAGCIDARVNVRCDRETRPGAVIVQVDFGNRCGHRAAVDFTRLRLYAGDPHESPALVAYDPRGEIVAGNIAAHGTGTERIEYDLPDAGAPPGRVCVVAGRIFDAAPPLGTFCFAPATDDDCPTELQ